jgi:hypothetical protein
VKNLNGKRVGYIKYFIASSDTAYVHCLAGLVIDGRVSEVRSGSRIKHLLIYYVGKHTYM